MNATLVDCCRYEDGYIERLDGMSEDIPVEDCEILERGLAGWGRANAVVLVDGSTYLAVIEG